MLNRFFFAFWVLFYFSPAADAATYYVAKNGATTSCKAMQDINTPASSILSAIECANESTGNIVEIRQGTYDETLDYTNSPTDWPSHTVYPYPPTGHSAFAVAGSARQKDAARDGRSLRRDELRAGKLCFGDR